MKPREYDAELFGAMADRLRAAADELRLAGKTRDGRATARRLETYARAIEDDLQDGVSWPPTLTPAPRTAGS